MKLGFAIKQKSPILYGEEITERVKVEQRLTLGFDGDHDDDNDADDDSDEVDMFADDDRRRRLW